MIIINTLAYNAEKTIARTIESVLSQTYERFEYYIIDNGSKDRTFDIMSEYAKNDNRIHLLQNAVNNTDTIKCGIPVSWSTHKIIELAFDRYPDNSYFCTVDADDSYSPEFLESMLEFIRLNNLDIAVCGSDFINIQNNRFLNSRRLPGNLILEGQEFVNQFPIYHQFMRTVWGKLFSLSVLVGISEYRNDFFSMVSYGLDTLFSMYAFRKARRVGILSKSLHQYYVSPKSSSYQFNPKRIVSDRILHEESVAYLRCYGEISKSNMQFLYNVYCNAIKDTLNVVMNADLTPLEKLEAARDVFTCETTRELLNPDITIYGNYRNYVDTVLERVLSQSVCLMPKAAKTTVEILVATHGDLFQLVTPDSLTYIVSKMPEIIRYLLQKDYGMVLERLHTWFKRHNEDVTPLTEMEVAANFALHKSDEELFILLLNIKRSRPQSSKALNINEQISRLIIGNPLLTNVDADLASSFPDAIRWVIKGNYKQALDAFISIQDIEIDDEAAENYFMLGQNLSAAAENSEAYIYFKKLWITYMLDNSRKEEAGKELDEFEQLLPDDADFIALRKRFIS